MIIGITTGYMYANGIYSVNEQEKILKLSGVNAFEINLGSEKEIIKRVNLVSKEKFGDFDYRSFHLPCYNKNMKPGEQISLAKKVINRQEIKTALIHPDEVPERFLEEMVSKEIPLAIENMDKEKNEGYNIKGLERLIKTYKLTLVLDVQHAYEHDPKMVYAKELFDTLKSYLVHIHISGKTDKNCHELVHLSSNKNAIIKFTGDILSNKKVPIILEGGYKGIEEVKKEIEFLTKELKFN